MTYFTRIIFCTIVTLWLQTTTAGATTAPTKAPKLQFPVECSLGEDCWILHYMDYSPNDGQGRDFKCNPRSYNGHKGTDIALRSMAELRSGVNVIAARDGTIYRVRDGQSDARKSREDISAIQTAKTDCGNGVLIDHGHGFLTQYCHLKQGSITVEPGDIVTAGTPIAQIGNSGASEMPHLHFNVYWENAIIDPFTGANSTEECGTMKTPLWAQAIPYDPVALYDGGFSGQIPNFDKIENGSPPTETLSRSSKAFVFWTAFLGVRQGDAIHMEIRDSNNIVVAQRNVVQNKTRDRQYYTVGRRFNERTIPPGYYTGYMRLTRAGHPPFKREFPIEVR